jgi:hypothetical protein
MFFFEDDIWREVRIPLCYFAKRVQVFDQLKSYEQEVQ